MIHLTTTNSGPNQAFWYVTWGVETSAPAREKIEAPGTRPAPHPRRRVTSAPSAVSPVVSLDVLPADVPAEYAPAMVSACSGALTSGSCALAGSLPESAKPEAVALVLWQGGNFLQVTVRVSRGGGQWTARALVFSERDSIAERWTTVGLTVATLVGEMSPVNEPGPADDGPVVSGSSAPRPTSADASPVSTAPSPRPTEPIRPWRAALGALAGQGWVGGRAQLGGFVSIGFRPGAWPLLAQALGSYSSASESTTSGRSLKTNWISLGLGVGTTGTLTLLDLVGTALVEVAYRRVRVSYAGAEAWDHEFPVRLRGSIAFPAHGRFAATAGAAVRLSPWDAGADQAQVLRAPTPSLEALAGLEVRL